MFYMVKCTFCKKLKKVTEGPTDYWCSYLKAYLTTEVVKAYQSKDLKCDGYLH